MITQELISKTIWPASEIGQWLVLSVVDWTIQREDDKWLKARVYFIKYYVLLTIIHNYVKSICTAC